LSTSTTTTATVMVTRRTTNSKGAPLLIYRIAETPAELSA
jgi:hypothetical protein